jgi:hypothetical protein
MYAKSLSKAKMKKQVKKLTLSSELCYYLKSYNINFKILNNVMNDKTEEGKKYA